MPARIALAASLAVCACLQTAVAQASYNVYAVAAGNPGTLLLYNGDASGALTLNGTSYSVGAFAQALTVSPDGNSFYVVNTGTSTIGQYDIGAGGLLTVKSPATVAATANPRSIALGPDGESAYVPNSGSSGEVDQYDVAADGKLTAKAAFAVTIGLNAWAAAVNPDGRSLYVTNSSSNRVYQFTISQTDGSLTAMSTAFVATGSGPQAIAVTPDGEHVYTANSGGSTITHLIVAADGSLTPALSTAATSAVDLAVSPDGNSLYTARFATPGFVDGFTIASDGSLAAKSPASFAAGNTTQGVAIAPDQASLYAGNNGTTNLSQFSVAATGLLSAMSPATVGGVASMHKLAVIPDQGPTASFSAAAAAAGSSTSFDGSTSSGSQSPVVQYVWDFGDSTSAVTSSPTTTHTYASAGNYTVTLRVIAAGGHCSDTQTFNGRSAICNGSSKAVMSQQISVSPAAPSTPSLELTTRQRSSQSPAQRFAAFSAGCGEVGCEIRASGKVVVTNHKRRKRTFKLKAISSSVAADSSRAVKLRIASRVRRAMRRAVSHRGKAVIQITVAATSGAQTATKQLRIRVSI
ncbi:MAG: beta-propeller fold lactonase family protein [Solirubrobacterales bacterium]